MDERCKTKYPIVLIHGTGFRDLKWPVYWGRISNVLLGHGAIIHYGLQDSWGSTESNARVIKERISDIVSTTGCGKVNIIAHSKGGLDARMAASFFGADKMIASITTIATPHHGSKTVDKVLRKTHKMLRPAAFAVNNWIRLMGDQKPDFKKVCEDFTTDSAAAFNEMNPDCPDIYYQSYACVMRHPTSDISLSIANFIISSIEGENDGLVSASSAKWGEEFTVLRGTKLRGVSHLDAIDFRRKTFGIEGFEDEGICGVYISIAEGLKQRGL